MSQLAALLFALCISVSWALAMRSLLGMYRTPRLQRTPPWLDLLTRIGTPLLPLVDALASRRQLDAAAQANLQAGLSADLSPRRWLAAHWGCALWPAATTAILGVITGSGGVVLPIFALLAGATFLPAWRRGVRQQRELQVLKELPAYLDILTLCVEAGAALPSALRIAVEKSPESALRGLFQQVLDEIRAGRTRVEALESVARSQAIEGFTTLVAALVQAEGQGVSLGRLLRLQAEQRTAERHARAEKLAMQAPVKMLGPLILCIFPCTFVVIAVPVAARMVEVMP
ncbi:MAG: hypothetical protein RL026_2238 [Pseudomonadota bacterium]|jgi:tight adherence protein C